jgi:predicted MFS family arabinose efflux permease
MHGDEVPLDHDITQPAQQSAAAEEPAPPRGLYRWYVVTVLFAVYALNFLDRQVINILGESIKRDLKISDTRLGLLMGTAFALFYSTLGLPIARLADRTHRVNIIAVSLMLWSGFTAACGLAGSFVQLFLFRLGVGIGEAGGTPPSQSLIADYFSHHKRSLALALFNSGPSLGGFLGFLLGGYAGDWFGWRTAFMIAGAPGLLAALLLKLTVKEPVRGRIDGLERHGQHVPPLGQTLLSLLRCPSYLWLISGSSFSIFSVYVAGAWLPSLFIRLHGFSAHEIGRWMAASAALGGVMGSLGGGFAGTLLKKRWARGELWLTAICCALVCPLMLVTVLSRSTNVALAAMLLLYVFAWVWIGPTSSLIQRVVPIRARALSIGGMLFLSSVTALAFGPTLVGVASDALQASRGPEALRVALSWASIAGLFAAFTYLMAARHIRDDVERSAACAVRA